MEHWREALFIVVCLMTVLMVIRYWLVVFVNHSNQRNRYTVVVTSDFGTYTFTGATVDFVPAEEYDQDRPHHHWRAFTHLHSKDDMMVTTDRVVKGYYPDPEVWSDFPTPDPNDPAANKPGPWSPPKAREDGPKFEYDDSVPKGNVRDLDDVYGFDRSDTQQPLGEEPSVFDLRKDATGLRRKKDD